MKLTVKAYLDSQTTTPKTIVSSLVPNNTIIQTFVDWLFDSYYSTLGFTFVGDWEESTDYSTTVKPFISAVINKRLLKFSNILGTFNVTEKRFYVSPTDTNSSTNTSSATVRNMNEQSPINASNDISSITTPFSKGVAQSSGSNSVSGSSTTVANNLEIYKLTLRYPELFDIVKGACNQVIEEMTKMW